MIRQRDIATLAEAGIDNVGTLVAAAAEFVRRHPLNDPVHEQPPLPTAEAEFLRSLGARGLDADDSSIAAAERSNLTVLVAEYAQLVASADTATQVADRLGVKSSRVRQRIANRSLHSIDTAGGRVFPRFQFSGSTTLPDFERVLAALGPGTHPVAVARFFLTPTPDLESDLVDGPLSPREWLLAGLPVEPVVELAAAP